MYELEDRRRPGFERDPLVDWQAMTIASRTIGRNVARKYARRSESSYVEFVARSSNAMIFAVDAVVSRGTHARCRMYRFGLVFMIVMSLSTVSAGHHASAAQSSQRAKLSYTTTVSQLSEHVHFPIYLPSRIPPELGPLEIMTGQISYYKYSVEFDTLRECAQPLSCVMVEIIGAADAFENTPPLSGIPYTLHNGVTGFAGVRECGVIGCSRVTLVFEVKHHVYDVEVELGSVAEAVAIANSMIEVFPGRRPIVFDRTKYVNSGF